jgi:hypothetical protein
VLRNKFQLQGPRLSPDSRVMSFVSNLSGRNEVYAVPFDPAAAPARRLDDADAGVGSGRSRHGVLEPQRQGAVLPRRRPRRDVRGRGGHRAAKFGKPRVLFRPAADIAPGLAPARRTSAATASGSSSRSRGRSCAS